jgi:hypothetical protein
MPVVKNIQHTKLQHIQHIKLLHIQHTKLLHILHQAANIFMTMHNSINSFSSEKNMYH